MRNTPAVLALLLALLALAALAAGASVAWSTDTVSWLEAGTAVPPAGLLALLSLALSGRGRALYQRTLGRAGGRPVATAARVLGLLALLLCVTAGLALGVFGVLVWTDGLTRMPW